MEEREYMFEGVSSVRWFSVIIRMEGSSLNRCMCICNVWNLWGSDLMLVWYIFVFCL